MKCLITTPLIKYTLCKLSCHCKKNEFALFKVIDEVILHGNVLLKSKFACYNQFLMVIDEYSYVCYVQLTVRFARIIYQQMYIACIYMPVKTNVKEAHLGESDCSEIHI